MAMPNSMTDDDTMTPYWTRYEHLKYNDVMKNVLIEELISKYEGLKVKHETYVREHDENGPRARESQLLANMDQLQRIMNRAPFIIVLVDGDNMMFNQAYLRDGANGGMRAAAALHDAVAEWAAANVVDCDADVKVVVRVYASVKSLADAYIRSGVVTSPTQVEEFSRGFTRGNALFDFVDLGYGKGGADADDKLADVFNLHLYDYHCRQVIVGCSHNSSCARSLEQCVTNNEAMPRITLLEGSSFEKERAAFPFSKAKFAGILQESKANNNPYDLLGDLRRDSRALSGASSAFTPRNATPFFTPGGGIPQIDGPGLTFRPPHLRSDSLASSTNSSDNGVKTWAGAAKVAAALPFTDLPRPTSQHAGFTSAITRNKKGQRLDVALEYDREEVQRLKKLKCCNQHYIGQGCCHYNAGKVDKCPHAHDFDLSTRDMHHLRVIARETPCKRGSECDDIKCIYGHSCPFPMASEGSMRGIGCLNGSACRFPDGMHGMDKVPVKMIKVTGTF